MPQKIYEKKGKSLSSVKPKTQPNLDVVSKNNLIINLTKIFKKNFLS